jgi:hypothetical protein
MELDPSLGGQMQKQVTCNKKLLEVCLPMLEGCDAQFSDWYRSKKGPDSIHKLVRLQSFITRYRVNPDESAGLLRHIDGVQVRTGPSKPLAPVLIVAQLLFLLFHSHLLRHCHHHLLVVHVLLPEAVALILFVFVFVMTMTLVMQVDGSLILALPTDAEWRGSGGGVTVWEGPEEDEVQWDYPMNPGDICFLDHYIWHQGNPITAGERWALVIFYRTKKVKGTRFSRVFLKAAAERKRKMEAEVAAKNPDRQVTVAERAR